LGEKRAWTRGCWDGWSVRLVGCPGSRVGARDDNPEVSSRRTPGSLHPSDHSAQLLDPRCSAVGGLGSGPGTTTLGLGRNGTAPTSPYPPRGWRRATWLVSPACPGPTLARHPGASRDPAPGRGSVAGGEPGVDAGSLTGVDPPGWDDHGDAVATEQNLPPVRIGASAGFQDPVVMWTHQHQIVQRCDTAGPPRITWWASQPPGGASQPGKMQPPSLSSSVARIEPPRCVRRLETLGGLESCQGTRRRGIRLS
jgi:hypothetical protein